MKIATYKTHKFITVLKIRSKEAKTAAVPCRFGDNGKIEIIPCTEDYVTKRVSKHGPKGTTIEINKNVDSEFYHNMFCRLVGLFSI